MALNFKKPAQSAARQDESSAGDALRGETFDLTEDRDLAIQKFENSGEMETLTNTIAVYEPETINTFGAEAAQGISKVSDSVLNSMNMSLINETGDMLVVLSKIMEKFDIRELQEKPGVFKKLFGSVSEQVDKVLAKYHTMGEEIDKIYGKLKQYEQEINESNKHLSSMFTENMEFYHDLLKYIIAGEHGVKEIKDALADRSMEFEAAEFQGAKNEIQTDIINLQEARNLLEARVMDLRIAENVAMQSIPMLKTIQFSNLNLIRKINSAFIITLPIFKQALAQAILLKRQQIQAESLAALDKKTNEMLLKNAQNAAEQAKLTAQLAAGSSIKTETLEQTWKTIIDGIAETKQIQDNIAKQREADRKKLDRMKAEFNRMFGISDSKKRK
ncbi:MAG: toxic anion resistance protein [Fusobacteriaceae bacterium]|nr:toxic anion resistance protein [Fusobacteriaceae bacterium]